MTGEVNSEACRIIKRWLCAARRALVSPVQLLLEGKVIKGLSYATGKGYTLLGCG